MKLRFAITGPESSGKSTLATLIAEHYQAQLIPEFARDFLLIRDGYYTFDDLDRIAKGQLEAWEQDENYSIQICDTEMLVLKIWSEFKYNKVSLFITKSFAEQQFTHYFLCRPDIPWEDDPLREHPEQREELFELYLQELTDNQLPFTIIEGNLEHRLQQCLQIISNFFNQ